MLELKFVPTSLGEKFTGFVMIRPPLARERLRYIKECNFKFDDKGEIQISIDNIDIISKMIEIAEKHVISVSIEKEGFSFKTFQELETDQEAQGIVTEIASQVLKGFTLGKH